jgi:phage gp29-like protein
MANIFQNILTQVKNIFYVPITDPKGKPFESGMPYASSMGGSIDVEKNLAKSLSPVPAFRIKQDVQQWREAIKEAELPILPFRYKMQIAYLDTVLDPHLLACMERRKNLTMLRNFEMVDKNGVKNDEWSKFFDAQWFRTFLNYSLDAQFYGYSLISMGDIEDNIFKNINIIRRCNISPDRHNVAPVPYSPDGADFLSEPYSSWHIWIKTHNPHGLSSCGYGLLYELTHLVIMLKNNLIYNSDYAEVYGMPFRQMKTSMKNEEERKAAELNMQRMASNNYIITDTDDEIIFHKVESGGYSVYSDLEERLNKLISKIVLGHSDALDSVPGRLGSSQGVDSPVSQAMTDTQAVDANFIIPIVNEQLIPLMRFHGINIPEDLTFNFTNDIERTEEIVQKNQYLKDLSQITKTFADAGWRIDESYIEELTGLKLTEIPTKTEVTSENVLEDKKQEKQDASI